MNEVLDFICDHIDSLREEKEEATDPADVLWFDGAIEVLEYIVDKFGDES